MKSNEPNIEKLLKDAFDNHEAEVNPAIWSKIQAGIVASAAAGSAGTAAVVAAKTTISISKIVLAAAITGSVATGTWYIATSGDADKSVKQTNGGSNTTQVVNVDKNSNEEKISSENQNTYTYQNNHTVQPSPIRNEKENNLVASNNSDNQVSSATTQKDAVPVSTVNTSGAESGAGVSAPPTKPVVTAGQIKPFIAKINYNPQGGYAPAKVLFSNAGDEAVSVKWEFGDGQQSFASSPSHLFEKAGSYLVKLTAYDNEGRMNVDSVMISFMASNVNFDVAAGNLNNVFSPNGDGINDTFNPLKERMVNANNITVTLFDRSRLVVSKWESEDGSWDGRLPNGQMAEPGAYYCMITFVDSNGKVQTIKHVFQLVK